MNWPTLWMSWRERELREFIVLPIIVLIMLVPVGAFSGETPFAWQSVVHSPSPGKHDICAKSICLRQMKL